MSEYHRIPLIHRNQIPQPTDAGKGERMTSLSAPSACAGAGGAISPSGARP